MVLRRRAWLCHEGWYYAAVLAFIVGGAVLRSVNLLVVLAGLMIAPLLLNWRMVMAALRGVDVRRKPPPQLCAGEPLTVELSLTNQRRWLASWLIVVEDTLRAVHPLSRKERPVVARAIVAHLPPQTTVLATYRLTIPRRGIYRLGPLRVSTRFPLGLVRAVVNWPDECELVVAPKLGTLTANWSRLLEAELAGEQRQHPQSGIDEGDYYSLRPFQSGDSRRWIHWRTTAKLNVPTVRQFERQRSFNAALVIDPWLPEQPPDEERGRLEYALSFAATAIAALCGMGQSQLTIAVAAAIPQIWAGPTSAAFCREVFEQLARLQGQSKGDVAAAVHQIGGEVASGAAVLVISSRPQDAVQSPGIAGAGERLIWIDAGDPALGEWFTL